MENKKEKEELEIEISLSNQFYNIYKDQANAIAYARNHRTHKCYNCNKYGHIAKECGKICDYCKKFHPTTTCLGRLIDLMKRILEKMDSSYNKNMVFLNKLINRNYDDLQWILSKKHFNNLSIDKQELQIQPTYVYDEEALKELQKYNFKPKILKDTIDTNNDEDENEIDNFYIFNQYKINNRFVRKIKTSEDKKYKYYKILKNNNQFKVDINNILKIQVVGQSEIKNKFTLVENDYYASIYDSAFEQKYLNKSFNSLKAQINKKISDTINKYSKLKEEQLVIHKFGDHVFNALSPKLLKINEYRQQIDKNRRNKVFVTDLNNKIKEIKEEMLKIVLSEKEYHISKCNSLSTLIEYCDKNNLNIQVISKIIEIEPVCTLRTKQMKSVPYLSVKLQNYSDIYKDIREIGNARKEISKLNKRISDLEAYKDKKNKSIKDIMEKFNNLKEKYINKKNKLQAKYKNEVMFMKKKYIKNKHRLDNRLDSLRIKKSRMYDSIGKMIDKSNMIYDHINMLRDKQISLLKQMPRDNKNSMITNTNKNKYKTYYKEEKYNQNGDAYDADGF